MTTLHETVPQTHPENHHLSSLAVMHEIPPVYVHEHGLRGRYATQGPTGRPIAKNQMIETSDHTPLPDEVRKYEGNVENSTALRIIRDMLSEEAAAQRSEGNIHPDGSLDWTKLAGHLMEEGSNLPPGEEREQKMLASAISARFEPDIARQAGYLKSVYEKNAQHEIGEACKYSPLVVLIKEEHDYPQPNVRITTNRIVRATDFVPVFNMDKEQLDLYVDNVIRLARHTERQEATLPAKQAQKLEAKKYQKTEEASAKAPNPDTADEKTLDEEELVTISLSGEKVKGSVLDLYKVERFALQQVFMRQQMHDVLAGVENGETALQAKMREMMGESNVVDRDVVEEQPLSEDQKVRGALSFMTGDLEDHAEKSFTELSDPTILKFLAPPGPGVPRHELTDEQRAALRYNEISKAIQDHMDVAQYLDIETFINIHDDEFVAFIANERKTAADQIHFSAQQPVGVDITSAPADGGGTANATAELIRNIMEGVLNNPGLHDASAEEIRDLAQRNRHMLLRLATHGFTEFNERNWRREDMRVERNEKGELELINALEVPEKGSLDMYAAAILGCPALQLQHPTEALLTIEQKAAHGTSNYVDRSIAAVINAAYERGIFSIDNIRQYAQQIFRPADPNASAAAPKLRELNLEEGSVHDEHSRILQHQ